MAFLGIIKLIVCVFMLIKCVISPPTAENPEFESADLTIEIIRNNKLSYLEAFRGLDNAQIIDFNKTNEYGKLKWMSIGQPTLTLFSDSLTWYKSTPDGFFIKVSFLNDDHKELFKKAIQVKYRIDVESDQIKQLVPDLVKCKMELTCQRQPILILGESSNRTLEFPLKVNFKTNQQNKNCLENVAKANQLVDVQCHIEKSGIETSESVLTIKFDELSKSGIVDRLFGKANFVYVTRNQEADLSSDIYSSLKIYEDYDDISVAKFESDFLNDIIKRTSDFVFKPVDFTDGIGALSSYNIDDLRPNIIRTEYERVLKVNKIGNKSHISFDKDHYNKRFNKSSEDYQGSLGGSGWGVDVNSSARIAQAKEHEWENSGKNLTQQLNELNDETTDEITWEIKGEKITPKNIALTKLVKSQFSRNFTIENCRRVNRDVIFERSFVLSSSSIENKLNSNQITANVGTLLIPKERNQMVNLFHIISNFDKNKN